MESVITVGVASVVVIDVGTTAVAEFTGISSIVGRRRPSFCLFT